jgi:hypothetical protein
MALLVPALAAPILQAGLIFDVQLNNNSATMSGTAATGFGAADVWNNLSLASASGTGPYVLSTGLTANSAGGSQATAVTLAFSQRCSGTAGTSFTPFGGSISGQGANPSALMGRTQFIQPNGGSGYGINEFLFSGLLANTTYTLYGYAMGDKSVGSIGEGGRWNTYAGTSASGSPTASADNTGVVGATASDVTLSANQGVSYVVMNATTDASGHLFITEGSYCGYFNQITGDTVINGLQLVEPTVVPETTNVALLLTGCVLVTGRFMRGILSKKRREPLCGRSHL